MWGEEMERYLGLWGLPLLEGINVALMGPQLVPKQMSCYKKGYDWLFLTLWLPVFPRHCSPYQCHDFCYEAL